MDEFVLDKKALDKLRKSVGKRNREPERFFQNGNWFVKNEFGDYEIETKEEEKEEGITIK